jgi:AraC family L-rhamnose operon transcriptional activator RhaR
MHLDAAALRACRGRLRGLAGTPGGPEYRAERVGWLLMFLGELARHAARARRSAVIPPAVHPAVHRAMRLFQLDLRRDWSAGELAATLGMDESYLGRRFKAATGLPPLAYLARLRAERAASLLLREAAPIADIGREVGWPDANYFARRFRAHFGLSASEYRRRFAVGG